MCSGSASTSTDLSQHSAEHLAFVEAQMNDRPRKRLVYARPQELIAQFLLNPQEPRVAPTARVRQLWRVIAASVGSGVDGNILPMLVEAGPGWERPWVRGPHESA